MTFFFGYFQSVESTVDIEGFVTGTRSETWFPEIHGREWVKTVRILGS